jgi:D-alanine-D-alanine ligase
MMSKKKNILVVLGGTSRERKISLESGKACIRSMKRSGYNVRTFDPKKNFFNEIDKKKIDVIFNALHGKNGEDGNAQSHFEYLKIPYTHSGVLSSMKCMDKEISKKIFNKNKILTAKSVVIKDEEVNLNKIIKKYKLVFPLIVKPTNEGSSIGVTICKNIKSLKLTVKRSIKDYKNLMIENFIDGQEIQVAVMNGKALGAIELKPKRIFYDYTAKYSKAAKTEHIMPANISKKFYQKALKIAEKTHKVMKCKGITRSDFKFYNNEFYLLEINTQPGMTSLSLVPEIAKYKKISFDNLVRKIIEDASINR